MGCRVNVSDAVFLENFSSQTRYPYEFSSTVAPDERYTMNIARDAFNAATKIYEAMKQLVEKND